MRTCQLINTQLITWIDVICEQDVAASVVSYFMYFVYGLYPNAQYVALQR